MVSRLYRDFLRQLKNASLHRSIFKSPALLASARSIFEHHRKVDDPTVHHDMQNVITFMHSQQEYKTLLARYNPLSDLTPEERIKATARRVGLDMPKSFIEL